MEFGACPLEFSRIDEVKAGEYVLSLNEKTGKIEPAKIKGLMDMGVKPIFKIEIEDGKTIRTTGNHPYLVQKESISPRVKSVQSIGFNRISLPRKRGNSDKSLAKETSKDWQSFCGIFNKTTENISDLQYWQKSSSLVINTRFSFRQDAANSLSLTDLGACLTSNPLSCKNLPSSLRTFSSSKNFGLGVDDDIVFFGQGRGVVQSGDNILSFKGGESFQDFSNGFTGGEHFQNLPDHNSGAFENGFAMANARVGDNPFVDNNFSHKFNNSDNNNQYNKADNGLSNVEDRSL